MSNEAQYYHPIIEAMLAHKASLLEQERQKNAVASDKARLALEAQAGARAQKELENRHDFEQQSLSNAHDLAQSLIQERQNQQRRQQFLDIASGVAKARSDPFDATKSILPYSGESIDPRALSNPQELQDLEAQGAGKKAGATATATNAANEPFQIGQEQRQFKYSQAASQLQHINRLDELAKQGVNQEHLAQINGQNQLAVAGVNGKNHILAAQIAQGIDPTGDTEENSSIIQNHMHQLTIGNEDESSLPPALRRAITAYAGKTGWTIPNKKFGDNLTSISQIQDVLKDALDLANNYSKDSTTYLQRTNPLPGIFGVSDVNAKAKDLNSRAMTVAKTFDSNNRSSQAEAQRSMAGLFDPNQTAKQNLDNINSKISSLNNLVDQRTAGMPAEQRNLALSSRGISMFGGFVDKNKALGLPTQAPTPAPGSTPVPAGTPQPAQGPKILTYDRNTGVAQ